MIVVKFPGGEFPAGVDSAFDFDEARRTEVGPGEFFFARPYEFDGTIGGFREASGFDGSVAGVLAAVGRARVGNDNANAALGNVKSVGDFGADSEGALRAGPDSHVAAPQGDCGARLERGVSDVGNGVGRFEFVSGVRQTFGDRAFFLLFASGVGAR